MKRIFKYYPDDFGQLKVKVLHMDLDFDVYDGHTIVRSDLKLKTLEQIKTLQLNAKNLDIRSITCNFCNTTYDYKNDIITISFEKDIPQNTEFIISTETICKPTNNILEGIYYDETPNGAPPQQITQCQQWGFQRIVPCIDDMTAKCTYTTTITADKRYTNIITNGDVAESKTKTDGRAVIKYNNIVTPMAPYLFFLGVGTYSTFSREFEYPNGDKFMLELLVPPNSDRIIAENALEALFDSIMWIHLFTGPDTYKNEESSTIIYKLIQEREKLKKAKKDYQEIAEQLKDVSKDLTLGYKYTGTVYREIGMQNSDFGGMENVGNTTITTNRIMPFNEMTDGAWEYMIRVKAHEFYHNLNGSEVTGWSPFEIWLNEAVTVHIDRAYSSAVMGKDYMRLQSVLGILSPDGGTLMLDQGVASMPIEPDGFNDPNELITGITYVKAPEFVRMIETLMGNEEFVKGLDLYHTKFKHSNATREQWLECMEKTSKLDLKEMAHQWLKQTGYPIIDINTDYDADNKKYTISVKQTTKNLWQFPIAIALFNDVGAIIAEKTEWIKQKDHVITFENVDVPDFASINRGFSFYGKIKYEQTKEELRSQLKFDTDIVNRYMAFYHLTDKEKLRLLKDEAPSNEVAGAPKSEISGEADVDEEIIDLFFEMLSNEDLMNHVGPQILTIFESVEDPKYSHKYWDLYNVRKKISTAIAKKYEHELKDMYIKHSKLEFQGPYMHKHIAEIKNRQIKNVCLGLLSRLDNEDVHKLIKAQFNNADNATDKIISFRLYLNSSAKDKVKVLEEYEKEAKKSLVSWESFLGSVASNDSDDCLNIIQRVESSKDFRIEQANDQRALYAVFAMNKKRSLLTEEGRAFLTESLIKLSSINEYTVGRMLTIFGNVDQIDKEHHPAIIKILMDLLAAINKEKHPSVYHTTKRILEGLPNAVKNYEKG